MYILKRSIRSSKVIIFQPADSNSGSRESPLAAQGIGQAPSFCLGAHSHPPHSLTLCHSPPVHICGMWEESRGPREYPRRRGHGENMQTPHRRGPDRKPFLFSHRSHTETTLNKTPLCQDLLHCDELGARESSRSYILIRGDR